MTIAVLDYNSSKVKIYKNVNIENNTEDVGEKVLDFLRERGHKESECHYMFGKNIDTHITYVSGVDDLKE